MMGIRTMRSHHPDLFRSCKRRTPTANAGINIINNTKSSAQGIEIANGSSVGAMDPSIKPAIMIKTVKTILNFQYSALPALPLKLNNLFTGLPFFRWFVFFKDNFLPLTRWEKRKSAICFKINSKIVPTITKNDFLCNRTCVQKALN